MSPRRRWTLLAWSLLGVWAALVVLTLWLGWHQPSPEDSPVAFATVGYALIGALVAARHPANAIGWLLLAVAVTIALQFFGEAYVFTESKPGYLAVAWLSGGLFNVWLALIVVFLPLVFPDGRLLSARWRLLWWFVVVTLVVGSLAVAVLPGELAVNGSIENPLGVHGVAATLAEAINRFIGIPFFLGILLAALSLVLRFRRSTGVERQQLKWFAFAALVTILGFLMAGAGQVLPGPWGDTIGNFGWATFLISCIFGIPIATGIAILRYRLYDIDVVINRTLVYGSLTAALVATYVVSILLLRIVLTPLTGQSDLAVAGSTLLVAAVFRPARSWIQGVVDRRFYRRRYDAALTLEDFSTRLRHELDLDAVGADLCTTADRTMQPAHVSLWLRAANR